MDKLRILWSWLLYRTRRRFPNRNSLEHFQARRLKRHLKFLKQHSPFFREMPLKLEALPLMDKATMMREFDYLNTCGIEREAALRLALKAEADRDFSPQLSGITVGLSSGTSGHRGLFLASKKERLQWAGAVLGRVLPGSLFGQHRIAFFLRANSNLYSSVRSRNIRFEYFDILKPLEQHLASLQSLDPTLLVAPASVLRALADFQSAGQLHLKPQKIVSVAEVLEPRDRDHIAQNFGHKTIHQVYQATEGFLASTCDHGTLHLNEDIVYIEREDLGNGRFIPIITDFTRRSQPIVRYRLNDILVARSEACPCGSPFFALQAIEGRNDDVFLLPSLAGGGPVRVYPDFVRRVCLLVAGISEYRVVQNSFQSVEVFLDSPVPEIVREVTAQWEILAREMAFALPQLTYRKYEKNLGKKMKRVERIFVPQQEKS